MAVVHCRLVLADASRPRRTARRVLLRAEPLAPTRRGRRALELVGQERAVPVATQVPSRSRPMTGLASQAQQAFGLAYPTPQRLQRDVEVGTDRGLAQVAAVGRCGRGTLDLGRGDRDARPKAVTGPPAAPRRGPGRRGGDDHGDTAKSPNRIMPRSSRCYTTTGDLADRRNDIVSGVWCPLESPFREDCRPARHVQSVQPQKA